MAFFLFILVNVALFIRPAEIVPSMQGWEIYFYIIVACLIAAVPDVMRHLSEKSPALQPITLCVLGLLIAIFISNVLETNVAEAWRKGYFFAKVVIYYLLFVSLVTTSFRLRTLLLSILLCAGTIAFVAVLRFHDVIQLETISALTDVVVGNYGDDISIHRLQGTGIFQDPNEFCVMLAVMVPICLYFSTTDRNAFCRAACAGLLPLFGYAIYLTYSRGGFLAFVGGLGTLFWTRFGWKKTVAIGLVGLPVLLILFAGRQTDISTSTGTASTRIELWRDWMQVFRDHPVSGAGITMGNLDAMEQRRSDEPKKMLAHNSYLQGFADLGFFGGCLFLGAFITAGWSLYRLQKENCVQINSDLKRMQPFVLASVTAFCIGMMTLSMCFIIPTYLILALAAAYARMAHRTCLAAPAPLRLDLRLLATFAVAGLCFLATIYMFLRSVA